MNCILLELFELPKEMKALVRLTSTSEKTSLLRLRRLTVLIELLINLPPAWESAEVAIVYEKVCVDFSADVGRVCGFFWVRAVHSIGLNTTVYHELVRFPEGAAMSVGPEDNSVAVVLKHLNGFNSKRLGPSYLWVGIFNNSTVEIYCYE